MKKNTRKIVLAAVLALILLVPATMIPIFAAEDTTTYLYAMDFTGMTALTKGQNGLSDKQAVPAFATIAKDPVKNGNKGDVVSMKMGVTQPENAAAAEEEARNGSINGSQDGTNVDRNLTVANPEFSYKTNPKIVFEIDYFLEENSSGTFESQIITYKYSDADTSGSWLNMWRVNTAKGLVYVLGATDFPVYIPVGEWVTLSLLVDMETGDVEFYVNNVYQLSTSIGKEKLTFDAGKWNIAKVNKLTSNGVGTPEGYSGGFYVDNVRAHTNTTTVTGVSVASGSEPLLYIDVVGTTGTAALAGPNDKILATAKGTYEGIEFSAATAEAEYLTADMTDGLLAHQTGASIRVSSPSGMRFATRVDVNKLADLQALVAAGKIKAVNIGTIITPWSYVKTAGAFTVEALEEKLTVSAKYLDVKATIGEYYADAGADGKATFTGSIVNIREGNLARDFAAVGYVKLTLFDGTPLYVYSYEYEDIVEETYIRNVKEIANTFINLSGWEKYQTVLKDLAGYNTEFEVGAGSALANVYANNTQLFFTLTGTTNMYCRLTYDGANGWRLQANAKGYNHFNDIGAAQALALYMDEGFDDVAAILTVDPDEANETLKITSGDSATYAVVSYGATFKIDFYDANGNVLYNVNSITQSDGQIVMSGSLNANEAVYGGGERFDAANRRGTSMNLFSYDAYDAGGADGTGTYMAIPLFSTSRGGGMFINRYEVMTVDFDKPTDNAWTVKLDNDLIDTYFYATGKMTDVLKAYTDMTGHASLPEEWAQGSLICRYSPDFNSLEGVGGESDGVFWFENITEIPGYTGYYTDTAAKNKVTASTTLGNGQFLYNGSGTRMYRYVVEGDEDINYNGKTGESYYIRVCKKSGPSGAGVLYIVENLIEAGMTPTGVVLEGHGWESITTNPIQSNSLVEIAEYLEEKDIKLTLYMGIASISGNMAGYKPEYQAWVSIYEYDTETGKKGDLIDRTYKIPKTDYTDNPDTVASGGTQQYLDITNPEAVDWYMNVIWGQLIDLGIDGCKIDFCETMPNEGYYKGMTVNDKVVDGYLEYDWYDETVFEGDTVHHAYASYFISLFYKSMVEQKAAKNIDDGFVVLSRGGGIGSQRNPYLWAGDQTRRFRNLSTQLAAVINSGLSGVPFMTYDMAGYAYKNLPDGYFGNYTVEEYDGNLFIADLKAAEEYESEIFVRSMQYTIFGNMVQTHGDVRHLYHLTEDAQQIVALYDDLHSELMWYSQAMSQYACDTGIPMIRHMVLQYQNDENVIDIDDQFMYGDALLVAPILTYNAKTDENNKRVLDYGSDVTRNVYLPEGTWIDLRTGEKIVVDENGKDLTVTVPFGEIPVYLNANSVYATALGDVFNGETWKAIMGDDALVIPVGSATDAFGKDIFED